MENGKEHHDALLELDSPSPLKAAVDLLSQLRETCTPWTADFSTLIAQHNWRDPVEMEWFGAVMESVWVDFQTLAYLQNVRWG
jgi:hypothetical protein